MLWRPTYETRILRDVALPRLASKTLDGEDEGTPSEGAMLGGFGPLAAAELGVWRRLLEEAFPDRTFTTAFIRPGWTPKERRSVFLATPPSLHASTLLAEDAQGEWARIVQPDRIERSFGAIFQNGAAKLLMVGLPTEEAWDVFRELLSR